VQIIQTREGQKLAAAEMYGQFLPLLLLSVLENAATCHKLPISEASCGTEATAISTKATPHRM